MKKVFACLSAFVLMLVAFGLALKPAVVNAAEVADGKFIVDPTLEEGDIPIYVMNSIFTTFPSLYDNNALKDPNYNIGRDYYWNEIKLVIPQFDAEGPTGQRYTVYSQGEYDEDLKSSAATKIYLWCLDEDGNVVTATQTRGGEYDWTSLYGPLFGDVSLSGIRYNVTGQDVVLNDLYREYGIINASNDTDPQYMVINGEGKVVRGVLKESVVAQENVEAFGYSVLFGYKDGQIVVREDVIGGAALNGLSAPDADLDIAQILVDDLNDPLLDPVTGEQQTDAEGNPLYNQISVDDPEGKPNLFYGKRYVWQWYSEEEFADVKVNTVAYKQEGWLADRWDYAVADPNGGYICFAFLSSLGSYVEITAEESAIHNASVDALVAAGLEAPEKIEETVTTTEEGTEVVEYAKYRRPVAEKVVIPVNGIMYRVGYLDYSGTATTPMFNEVIAHAFEDAMLYGRAPEYQAYAKTYNLTATGLVEKNAVVNGESFIVRNENGKLVVEVKPGAVIDVSELIEITGCLGGYAIAGNPAPEAGSNVAAALSYKMADVAELSYYMDIDGKATMRPAQYQYEEAKPAVAHFMDAIAAHIGLTDYTYEAWTDPTYGKFNDENIASFFEAHEEWLWFKDYYQALFDEKAAESGFTAYTAWAPNSVRFGLQALYAGTKWGSWPYSPDFTNPGATQITDYSPEVAYRYETWDEFVADFIADFNAYVYGKDQVTGAVAFWDQSYTDNADLQKKICDFFATEDWAWFGAELDKGIEAAGWTSYGKDHYYYYRCNVYEYLTKTHKTNWPASCGSFHEMSDPNWIGEILEKDYMKVEFDTAAYDVHDRFTLELEVTNGATGFVDTIAMDFVVVEDFTPLFRISEEALVVKPGQTAIDLGAAVKAYDAYYDARNDNVYGHDISRHIDWNFPEGFDPNNLAAGSYEVSARIDSQVNGSNKFAETSFVLNVIDSVAPTFALRNGGVIYVNNLEQITEADLFAFAIDNVDGNYLEGAAKHNWWKLASEAFEPGVTEVGETIATKVTVTDANGNSTSANVTIIVTGVEVEIPEVQAPVQNPDGGGEEPEPTAPTNCIAMGYVSSFVAAAGLALLVFKKRH